MKCSIAIAEIKIERAGSAVLSDDVQLSIPVEIAHLQGAVVTRSNGHCGLTCAVAETFQKFDSLASESGHSDVQESIAVKIGNHQADGVVERAVRDWGLKGSISVTQQN